MTVPPTSSAFNTGGAALKVDDSGIQLIADSTQLLPGLPSPVDFESFSSPFLTSDGAIVFSAYLEPDPDNPPSAGIYQWRPGSPIEQVIVEGDLYAGDLYAQFWYPDFNIDDNGQILLTFELPSTEYLHTISRFNGTDWSAPLATAPGPAPGIGDGGTFDWFGRVTPTTTQSGHVKLLAYAIGGESSGYGDAFGLWVIEPDSTIRFIVRAGMEVPTNVGPATLYGEIHPGADIANNGRAVFSGELAGAGIDQSNNSGIWSADPNGNFHLVVQTGQEAPGTDSSTQFDYLQLDGTNSRGDTTFLANLRGPSVDSSNREGAWIHRPDGTLQMLMRQGGAFGDSVGLSVDTVWSYQLASSGTVFGVARLDNALGQLQGSGLMIMDVDGNASTLVDPRESLPEAPGTTTRVLFPVSTNDHDQLLFRAELQGPEVTSSNDVGYWVTTRDGGIELLLREGDTVEFSDEDLRVVKSIYTSNSYGGPNSVSGFNDNGQVALVVSFTDNSSALLLFNTFAVPEPSSILLTMLGLGIVVVTASRTTRRSKA